MLTEITIKAKARGLEIFAKFSYTLDHRAVVLQGNADGLTRRSRRDCRQHDLFERNGEPSHRQMKQTETSLPTLIRILASVCRIGERTLPTPAELAAEQFDGTNTVATIYRVIRKQSELLGEWIEQGNTELKKLNV